MRIVPLGSHWRKLERADEHHLALQAAVQSFADTKPYGIAIHQEAQFLYTFQGEYLADAPSLLSLLVGDCLSNFRSALDHVAWQLSMKNAGNADRSEFPIFLERDKFWETDKKGKPTRGSGLDKIRNIAPEPHALIESLQPYHRADGPHDLHPLWLLQELSNMDKHRMLHVVGAVTTNFQIVVQPVGNPGAWVIPVPPQPFEDGAKLAAIEFRLAPDQQMQFYSEGLFGIAFSPSGPGKGKVLLDTMTDISGFVREILVRLEPFLA